MRCKARWPHRSSLSQPHTSRIFGRRKYVRKWVPWSKRFIQISPSLRRPSGYFRQPESNIDVSMSDDPLKDGFLVLAQVSFWVGLEAEINSHRHGQLESSHKMILQSHSTSWIIVLLTSPKLQFSKAVRWPGDLLIFLITYTLSSCLNGSGGRIWDCRDRPHFKLSFSQSHLSRILGWPEGKKWVIKSGDPLKYRLLKFTDVEILAGKYFWKLKRGRETYNRPLRSPILSFPGGGKRIPKFMILIGIPHYWPRQVASSASR
jgi:hypothetical protein